MQKKHNKENAKFSTDTESATILMANAAFFIIIPSFLPLGKGLVKYPPPKKLIFALLYLCIRDLYCKNYDYLLNL